MAYEIDDDLWEGGVRDQLGHRERGGYVKQTTTFYPLSEEVQPQVDLKPGDVGKLISDLTKEVELYIGSPEDRLYTGPLTDKEMTAIVVKAKGPSGDNREYVYLLADGMRKINPEVEDKHLYGLEKEVRRVEMEEQ